MTAALRHRYRPEVDGLRAVAILPVVLFHAGIPGFSGGFVGVDVFFVISGFLITRLIANEIRAGQFSLLRFYERRIRRIFPALFFLLMCCTLAGACLLYPEDYARYARSLVAATLFVSSFLFAGESGYFDGAAEEKPLLHTWSLSVEELFYLAFPLGLILSRRVLGGFWVWLFSLAACVSLGISVLALRADPSSPSAFYLVHYRAWELLLGAVLALHGTPMQRGSDLAHRWLPAVGVAMILLAVVVYSADTAFPGFAALVPCLGAALVIHFAGGARVGVARLLAARPVVFIGLISYSLYLWHWPLLVFFTHWAGRAPSPLEIGGLLTLAFAMAVVSWHWVERPFRGSDGRLSRPTLFMAAGASMAMLVAVGSHGHLTGGWISRYGKTFQALAAAAEDRDPRQEECLSPRVHPGGCDYGASGAPPTAALWGDSHAAVYAVALGDLARLRDTSVRVFTMWSCPPTTGWQVTGQKWREECAKLQERAMETVLESESIRSVVLAARFGQVPVLEDQAGATRAFYATVERLLAAGKTVVLMYPVPELPERRRNIHQTRVAGERGAEDALVSQRTTEFLAANKDAFLWLDALGNRDGLVRVYPHKALCDERYCYAARGEVGYYFDQHHLSLSGASVVSRSLDLAVFAGSREGE